MSENESRRKVDYACTILRSARSAGLVALEARPESRALARDGSACRERRRVRLRRSTRQTQGDAGGGRRRIHQRRCAGGAVEGQAARQLTGATLAFLTPCADIIPAYVQPS